MPYVPSVPYVDESIVSLVGGAVGAGTFTPGAWNVLNLNEDVINASWNKGMEQLHDFKDQMGALLDDATGWLAVNAATPIAPGSISVVAATEPAMTVSDTSPAQVYADFAAQANDVITALSAEFAAFFAAKFPNEQANYDAAEAYLLDAMSNATSGAIPDAIRAKIIADGRVEIVASASRAIAEATTRYAAMRHPLPPGALSGATLRIAQGALDAETTIIRQVAIKDFELAYQKIKDAVSATLANRAAALNATKEFILATVGQGYGEGSKITATAHAAETAMLNAASGYFNARINAQELLLKADIADETLTNDAEKANQQAELEQIQDYLKGFLAQAQALAAIATALTNNIRAGANSSYNVSI